MEYSLESLKLRIESTEDLDEFNQKTREAHKLASEKFYFGQINRTVKTREEFLELAANKLAKNGALTIAADIENDQDGAPIRLWDCRLNLHPFGAKQKNGWTRKDGGGERTCQLQR